MGITSFYYRKAGVALITAGALLLGGCHKDPATFDEDGVLEVDITRTEFGVPHVKADNLESLAFGIGYAYAEDNLCLLADLIVKYNSQRSKFFGPDQQPGTGDSLNLVNDFSYKALDIRAQAEAGFPSTSERARAMLSGYSKGYNHYLETTPVNQQDPRCAGRPWVRPIGEVDLLTCLLGIALLTGSEGFLDKMFVAAPPNESYMPKLAVAPKPGKEYKVAALNVNPMRPPEMNSAGPGSNGWALGRDKTESRGGMLLANPHLPHTGNLRLWQFHSIIPGAMDVMGASLSGMPGMVNIGYSRHMAWTHTASSARHFIVYKLSLDKTDPSGMTYLVDGQSRRIARRTLTVDVAIGGTVVPFTKDMFASDFGPMILVPEQLPWGEDADGGYAAFSIKDANRNNLDPMEFWITLNLARDMNEFQQAFKDYDGTIFNNTLAVDRNGNTFYIDDSSVPHLSDEAETLLVTDPSLIALRQQTGIVFLPGDRAVYDFAGTVPYPEAPKLERSDFVQNSNDSYWLTNPGQPMTGFSTMYTPLGEAAMPQSLRSRMGQRLLREAAGEERRFSLDELEQALLSTRNYLGEATRDDLLELCETQSEIPILIDGESVDLSPGCQALAQWDGLMNLESRGAHLFQEFAEAFNRNPQWINDFDPADPLDTPNTLAANQTVLEQLALAITRVRSARLPLDAPLGEVQFVERSRMDGTPTGEKLPWAGANDRVGGFNVFYPHPWNDGTLLPRHIYPSLPESLLSAEAGGYPISSGSSWMLVVEYTPGGPKARGLLTYSQATNPASPYYIDQTRYYSQQPRLRPIWFEQRDIERHAQSKTRLVKRIRPPHRS